MMSYLYEIIAGFFLRKLKILILETKNNLYLLYINKPNKNFQVIL